MRLQRKQRKVTWLILSDVWVVGTHFRILNRFSLSKDLLLEKEPKGDQPHGQPGGQVRYQEQCQRQKQLRHLVSPGEEPQQCRGHADQGNQPGDQVKDPG